ncbi:hypothetical protein ABK040_002991 [Willaertia magna]
MVYIRDGQIVQSRGFFGAIKYYFFALLHFIYLFFSSLNPNNNRQNNNASGGSGGNTLGNGKTIGRVKGPPKQGPNCVSGS